MSSFSPLVIAGSDQGLRLDKKSFLIPDNAFGTLENAYVWRDQVKKREGLKLLGRLRRSLTNESPAIPQTDGTGTYVRSDVLLPTTGEPNAVIQAGTLVVTIDPAGAANVFTDQGDGTLLRTSGALYDVDPGTYIDYDSRELNIVWDPGGTPPNGLDVRITFQYFPCFPVMGIIQRELTTTNIEQTIVWDQKYAYVFDGVNYNEYLLPKRS